MRLAVVILGIVAGQAILYGPSLAGRKILLPLDILATPKFYTPPGAVGSAEPPHNDKVSDLLTIQEANRRFVHSELSAGRFPLWNPYHFAGAPVLFARFSPFALLQAVFRSPVILAWQQLLAALVAGTGMYAFARRVLRLSFWPACLAAWCYPVTAFFVLWQGFDMLLPLFWMPWILLAVDRAVKCPCVWTSLGLAASTALVLASGQLDTAGQLVLCSGLYALWSWGARNRRNLLAARALKPLALLAAGWILGFMLVSPDILPKVEYAHTGVRVMRRSSGVEERPPIGIQALPPVVLPFIYGTTERDSLAMFPKGQGAFLEGTAPAYAGLLAALFAAPLAWCDRRRRHHTIFFTLLAAFGLSWSLNVPGIVSVLRLPGLNMMSHNRLTFATGFAITILAAIGLNALWRGRVPHRRWWFLVPAFLLAGLGAWSFYRIINLPEPLATQLAKAVSHGMTSETIRSLGDVQRVQEWFIDHLYEPTAVLATLGIIAWLLVFAGRFQKQKLLVSGLGVILLADLLWFGYGRNAQCDPALYFPKIPVLEKLRAEAPGRVLGYGCLPARLAEFAGLHDIRGYDAVDPARLMDVMSLAASPRSPKVRYAQTQWFVPKAKFIPPDGIRLSPVLDMLNVRYVIFRGSPPAGLQPLLVGQDYWVLENHSAMPRVYIPERAQIVSAGDGGCMEQMAKPDFDPRKIAYVEGPPRPRLLPPAHGTAEILSEDPTHIAISANVDIDSPQALLVLADLWDDGWNAYVDGVQIPVERVNNTVRGVLIGGGKRIICFRYEPASFRLGILLAGSSLIIIPGWILCEMAIQRRRRIRGVLKLSRKPNFLNA